ncbi:MAG: hypothetical protein AAF628_05995 [Planctomycetota bacterium]
MQCLTHRVLLPTTVALLALSAAGQRSLPAPVTADEFDLDAATEMPFMTENARLQQHYQLAPPGGEATPVYITALSLRYDGPSGGTTAAPFTVDRLRIGVGVSDVTVDQTGSVFARNLSAPLRTVCDVRGLVLESDGQVCETAQPWGGTTGNLRFVLAEPVDLVVPAGASLVVELRVEGNHNRELAARLDSCRDRDGLEPGESIAEGEACVMGAAQGPQLSTVGDYVPGGSFSTYGGCYPSGASVCTMYTTGLLDHEFEIFGTPQCWMYLDAGTGVVAQGMMASPGGEVRGPTAIPIPRGPELCGALLYVQDFGTTTPSPDNPAGVFSSNYRTITVGCTPEPVSRSWLVVEGTDANATVGTVSIPGGLAMRIE